MKEAVDIGITTGEIIGWDKGGLERDYPCYVPEDKLGGWDGYRKMIHDIHSTGAKVLTFVNYQILDSATEWYRQELHKYRRMDSFGLTENWLAWGESTLKAAMGADVRRHVPASVSVPGFRKLLDGYLTKLVEAGTDGLQVDKVSVLGQLDFNPHHDRDPDLPMCEDLVEAIRSLYEQCKAINPDFCLASEAQVDRFIPFVDVFYRAASAHSISTLRYTFPEWTACVHTSSPYDYSSVNGAVMLGAVLVVEPFNYTRPVSHPAYRLMRSYLKEVLALRARLMNRIFWADYLDRQGAEVAAVDGRPGIQHRVHADFETGKKAVVIVNYRREPVEVQYRMPGDAGAIWECEAPFQEKTTAPAEGRMTIPGERFVVLLES